MPRLEFSSFAVFRSNARRSAVGPPAGRDHQRGPDSVPKELHGKVTLYHADGQRVCSGGS
jgi:hypothetical protein